MSTFISLANQFTAPVAAEATPASFTSILGAVNEMINWIQSIMTSFATWIIENPLAMMYMSIFLAGVGIAFLFRILRSV